MEQKSNRTISITVQIFIAMILGGVAGTLFGSHVTQLGVFGKLLIQLIKVMAIPLVFFAIVEALITADIKLKSAGKLLIIVIINGSIAALIGLSLSNYFRAGESLRGLDFNFVDTQKIIEKKMNFKEIISGYIPESILSPFARNDIIGVVIIAILLGCALRRVMNRSSDVNYAVSISGAVLLGYKVFEQIILWLVHLIPLAVFGVMCQTVGEHGFAPFKGLSSYVAIGVLGLTVQILIVYQFWIKFVCKIPLLKFWSEARHALVYAFGTNSSLATLPLTLKTLDNLKVSKASSRLGACVGTNLNNDGILLYEAMAVLFVAQAYGVDLSLGQQITVILLSVVAAIGVAGVPEAGVVSLSLVLTTVGLSLEILPLLLTVDWVIARFRAVTNVMSDMTVSLLLDWKRS